MPVIGFSQKPSLDSLYKYQIEIQEIDSMGRYYFNTDYNKSISYYDSAVIKMKYLISKKLGSIWDILFLYPSLACDYHNISACYSKLGDNTSSIIYALRSLGTFSGIEGQDSLTNNNMAGTYDLLASEYWKLAVENEEKTLSQTGYYSLATKYYNRAINCYLKYKDYDDIAEDYLHLSDIYRKVNSIDKYSYCINQSEKYYGIK